MVHVKVLLLLVQPPMHFASRSIEADGRGGWADTENYGGLVDRESLNFAEKEDAPVDGAQIESMHHDFLKGNRLSQKGLLGALCCSAA